MRNVESPSSLLAFPRLAGAAEKLARKRPQDGSEEDWLTRVEDLRDRLAQSPFVALPLDSFVERQGAKERVVSVPRPPDRLLEEALLPYLQGVVEPLMRDGVHGYRRGRSTYTAALAASHALSAGLHEILMLDVTGFFESIDRARLREKVANLLPAPLVEIVDSLIRAPLLLHGKKVERETGIPPGRPISPVLANLFLSDVDAAVDGQKLLYLRYGDDLFAAASSGAALDAAESQITAAMDSLGLRLSTEKRRRFHYTGQPFVYLGHALDDKGVYDRIRGTRLQRITKSAAARSAEKEVDEVAQPESGDQPNTRTHTLYLTQQGLYVKARSGLVTILSGKEVVREVPLHRIDRVLVLAGVGMTSGFLSACVCRGIPVLFFVGRGKAYGSLVPGSLPNPLRLQSQYRLSGDPEKRRVLGREIVTAKMKAMLRRLEKTPETASIRDGIAALQPAVDAACDSSSLRGLEGVASRYYYEGFARRIHVPEFAFTKRSRRPPRDAINSLLSFTYSLLFAEMQLALLAHGLDPHPGLLHDLARSHPALASDLIEPYRILIADSFVLTLVNNHRVKAEGFEKREEAILMIDETRRTVLQEYEAFMARPAVGAKSGGAPRRLIEAAARNMLKVVLGETEHLDLPMTVVEECGATVEEAA